MPCATLAFRKNDLNKKTKKRPLVKNFGRPLFEACPLATGLTAATLPATIEIIFFFRQSRVRTRLRLEPWNPHVAR